MKQTVFRRIIALILCISAVLGCGISISSVAAEKSENETNTSVSETSLKDVKEILNAISYAQYIEKYIQKTDSSGKIITLSQKATDNVAVDVLNYIKEDTTAKVKKVKINEVTGTVTEVSDDYVAAQGEVLGIYTPDVGEVAFGVHINDTARYSIAIEYFPATTMIDSEGNSVSVDKIGSIERILKLDGKIPFAEARYLVMTKVWKNIYTIKMQVISTDAAGNDVYEDTAPYAERAEKCGLEYEVAADGSSITLKLPEGGWTSELLTKVTEEDVRFFTKDIDGNEIRCAMERIPEIRKYECKDVDGFYTDSFEFLFEEGDRKISLDAKSQSMVIKSITLFPQEEKTDYTEIVEKYKAANYKNGTDQVKIEAEFPFATSSQTIYPIEDSSSAQTSPCNAASTVLNTIGGEKWQTSGQWISYKFRVETSGLYQIVARYRQNVNDGIFSSRVLYIYSDGDVEKGEDGYYDGIPFKQASNLRFGYSTDWQVAPLKYSERLYDSDGNTRWKDHDVQFYFKEGVTYTVEFEVALGDMGRIVSDVSNSLTNVNKHYLDILKLTGAEPDPDLDYGFNRTMPDTMIGLIDESDRLYAIADELRAIAGEKSSNVATLEKIAWLLSEMGHDEDNVAKYLEQLKTYIGTLGTWINTSKTQPLQLDYIVVVGNAEELPEYNPNFFVKYIINPLQTLWHELTKFVYSFFRHYDRMGATNKNSTQKDTVQVWLAKGRDQTQVIRNLINNDFTPNPEYGHLVDLKLVSGATLLPSILAQAGPDVYIGISEDNIINYAIRGALKNIENEPGFYDLTSEYLMEPKTVDDFVSEIKADNYIIEVTGEGTADKTLKAMTIDGKAMYIVSYGQGKITKLTKDQDGSENQVMIYGIEQDGRLYEESTTFDGKTYSYKNVLDETGKKVKNPNAQFNNAAMYVLGLPDSDNVMHYYGLPEEQNFNMMFVRNDILADLGMEIPKSWDDIESTIATLQANNMQIGMSNDYRVFLYQQGSQLFADDGMRINLDSNVALDSFDYMCSLYTDYSFPYKYDFANRFRTGEMPIGIASYNATYNQLIVFATEIRGLWSFYPLPGVATYKKDANGYVYDEYGKKIVESIDNAAVATVSAISMISGCKNTKGAWDFMKWHVGAKCQVDYSNEMIAILGDSAKYATANVTALEQMPWTTDERQQLLAQFNNLASIPNYPGSYIIGRYTNFAFLDAYDDNINPVEALNKHINTINKEITRKREEFELETLRVEGTKNDSYQSLTHKRIVEATEIINGMNNADKTKYQNEVNEFYRITSVDYLGTYKAYVEDSKIDELYKLIGELRETQYSEFFRVADLLETAAESLTEYQDSYLTVKD